VTVGRGRVDYLRGRCRPPSRPLRSGAMTATVRDRVPLGTLLRDWRRRRRLSQLDLALEAGVSARHLSFLETGRSRPSREMVLHLAERLDVPLRDRNNLLLAAGFAPAFGERGLEAPELAPVRDAIGLVLAGHEPYPAVVVDRWWDLVAANASVALFTEGVAPELLEPPVNVLRLALHPDGTAPRIANLAELRAHLLDRLRRHVALTADERLAALEDELESYPAPAPEEPARAGPAAADIAVPLRLRPPGGGAELRFFSTIATFGTAVDITVAELAIEAFFPADAETAAALRERAGGST
jgi:transcriptional regulator with XRE-family HTH domain